MIYHYTMVQEEIHTAFQSDMAPEDFLQNLLRHVDYLRAMHVYVAPFALYHQPEGSATYIPIFGVDNSNQLTLFPASPTASSRLLRLEEKRKLNEARFEHIGYFMLLNYRNWFQLVKTQQKFWQRQPVSRNDIEQRLAFIDTVIANMPTESIDLILELFKYTYQHNWTTTKITSHIHIGESTITRLMHEIKVQVGFHTVNVFSTSEIDDMIAEAQAVKAPSI